MKTISTIFLILAFVGFGFGQVAYINDQYDFGLKIPQNFEKTDAYNDLNSLQAYICRKEKCGTFGAHQGLSS